MPQVTNQIILIAQEEVEAKQYLWEFRRNIKSSWETQRVKDVMVLPGP